MYIRGIGTCRSPLRLGASELSQRYQIDGRLLEIFDDIEVFQYEPAMNNALLQAATQAANSALRNAQASAAEMDGVFLITSTPDTLTPSVVRQLARTIGSERGVIQQFHASFGGVLATIELLAAQFDQCLIVVGDINSRLLPIQGADLDLALVAEVLQTSDGVGALVLDSQGPGMRIVGSNIGTRILADDAPEPLVTADRTNKRSFCVNGRVSKCADRTNKRSFRVNGRVSKCVVLAS